MRIMRMWRAHLAAISIFLAGPLFFYDPTPVFAASFPDDTNVHFAAAGGVGMCTNSNGHMNDYQPIVTPQVFTLCQKQSGATQWSFDIRNYSTDTLACSFPLATASAAAIFNCNTTTPKQVIPVGTYKGYVYWYVGGSTLMTAIDQRFKR